MEIPDSARLKFHFMTDADAERFYQLDSDPEVMRYITGRAMTREDIAAWYIPRLRQYADQNRGWGLWGMTTLEDHRYIGWILVRPMHFSPTTIWKSAGGCFVQTGVRAMQRRVRLP